jgi:hypothetical protein
MEAEGHGLALLMGHPLSELAEGERLNGPAPLLTS